MGQGPAREADLTQVRREQRAAEMQRCAQIAHDRLLTHAPTRSIVLEDGAGHLRLDPALRPGMTVCIWATKNKAHDFLDWLQKTSSREKSYRAHLAAEIIPFELEKRASTFSVGFAFEDDALKVQEDSALHLFSPETSSLVTPDEVLLHKVNSHRLRPSKGFVELVAIGLLTKEHLKQLESLLQGASGTTIMQGFPAIDPDNAIPVRYLQTHKMPVYRALSFACSSQRKQNSNAAQNCTSFVSTLFPDVLTCRNLLGLAMPNACLNEAVNNDDFGGCSDKAGTLYPTAGIQLKHMMKKMHVTEAEETRRRNAALLASKSLQSVRKLISKRASAAATAVRRGSTKQRR